MPKKQKTHKPKPTSAIRAITPISSELGTATNKQKQRKEDRPREIIPSPDISNAKLVYRSNNKTWIFPKSEKRFNELKKNKN